MISRFRTAKEQKVILERVEQGKVDILIGTHRLLSAGHQVSGPGLLVVDEEQRFGVRHKERLKQMRKAHRCAGDVATPIPRTLHMSLVGLRDMSVIETPPKDRMAIQTVVAKFDEKLVRSAIEWNWSAAGRCTSCTIAWRASTKSRRRFRSWCPRRASRWHGQMSETELER
jgi:transcription-repair coupling factor (superfamily II helicase)